MVVALAVLAVASTAAAQTFTGGLRGAVRDANGVIPGVTVQLISEETGATRDAVSNEEGLYNFAAVPPGVYTVKGQLTGFRTYEQTGIRVAAQQFVTIDITLEVGALQETITVTGAAPLIDTSTASGGGVIDSQQLLTLPSAGRSAFLFAVTLPTVVATGDPQFNRQQDQTNASLLSLGGGARRANNYLLDGVPVTDITNRASANPSMEAIADVAVQVHTYDAETGRTGGGTFNTATKSGTNVFAGSGFYQNRPKWGATNDYFNEKAGVPLPPTYFHYGAAGVGGPIVRNRTFFWASVEGYGSNTTRSGNARLPTDREKAGDFSQTFNAAGQLVVIYDPLTGDPVTGAGRQPFAGNVIPPGRLNQVARNLLADLPPPTNQVSNGSDNFFSVPEIHDRAIMYTGKVDHRFSDKVSLSGFYLYNLTNEPCANVLYPGLSHEKRYINREDYILKRRVNILALNNTWLPASNTVATARFGWTRFYDNPSLSIEYDPAQLGFAQSFLDVLQVDKFPRVTVQDYYAFGHIDPARRNYYSWSANGTLTQLKGRHTLKFGADYRLIGIDTRSYSGGAGDFRFDRNFTSLNPVTLDTTSGNAIASMLLGFPSGNPANLSTVTVSSDFNGFVHYTGFYAQDDFRVNSKLTFNYGARLEHETGMREENNGFTVGFDRTVNPGGQLGSRINPTTGQPFVGGLMYAGINGHPETQGDPPAIKFSPRLGAVYSINPRTVVRAGYGIYWAPWNYPAVGTVNYGNTGYTQSSFVNQNQFYPAVTINNPFPGGVATPRGNANGYLEGVGTQIEFVDQGKQAPYIQQYSVDINRELPGNMAVGFEYTGATGRDLGLGGTVDAVVNINQVPAQYMALGSALTELVPNPFFGLPAGQGKNVTSPTIQRRELLRPFPQFNDILMRQHTAGRNQYHAAIFKLEKRMSNGWGGRLNYTYSRLMDNQYGETNTYSSASSEAQDAYNLDDEWSVGLLDVPHKLVFSPIFELPFGEGKRWMTSGVGAAILGDWTISSIIAFESGFPIQLRNNNNTTQIFTRMQRANPGTGDLATDGSRDERLSPPPGPQCLAGQECGIGLWLNPAGATQAPAFTFGTLPRTTEDVRTPHRNNWDFMAAKDIPMGGNVRGQIKFELLNITNTVKTVGPTATVGSAQYGQIRTQRGFMRLTQIMFRVTW
jgi:hypothetical protein